MEKKKIKIILFLILFCCSIPLYSIGNGIYSLVNQKFSPFSSVAYHSIESDSFVNPAALPLVEGDNTFLMGLYLTDTLDGDVFRLEQMGYLQNQIQELRFAFLSKYISLSTLFGTSFADRHFEGGSISPYFDIYSNVDISLDVGYAFPYFSIGLNIRGGNSMVRDGKVVRNFSDIFKNAWFSAFDVAHNSERFGLGSGLLFYSDNFALGCNIENILNLEDGKIHSSWENIGSSTTLSIAVNANRFNKKGDLNLLYAKGSFSYKGFKNKPEVDYLTISGTLSFQFLPRATLSLGIGYSEKDHTFFNFDGKRGELSFNIKGEYEMIELDLGVRVDTNSWNMVSPTICLTYSN